MSNPTNLPILLGSLTFSEFQVAHLGPTDGRQDEAHWTDEAVLVTLESHFYLPPYANAGFSQDTSDKLEQLSGWVANWAEYCAEEQANPEMVAHCVEGGEVVYKPVELPTLAENLRDQLNSIVEDGFYRAGPEGCIAAADLMECLNYLSEPWF